MSPRTQEQFEEIRQEKRQIILDTAIELFAVNSYEGTSISQIAKKAEISKGLLYNYFESKEELLETILNKGIDDMLSLFDPNKDGVLEPHEMEFFIRESFKMIKENRIFWRLYWSVSFQPTAFKLIDKKIDKLLGPVTRMVVQYMDSQGFENPMVESMIFGGMLDGITLDYIMKPDVFPIDMIIDEIIKRYCTPKTN